jgi:hypothetical protein
MPAMAQRSQWRLCVDEPQNFPANARSLEIKQANPKMVFKKKQKDVVKK